MRFSNNLQLSITTVVTAAIVLSSLILQSMATPTSGLARIFAAQHNPLGRRTEEVGSSCDSEGQWNCMTSSWQRCASGEWSKEIQCAEGTRCTPSGYTDNLTVEYDGSVNGTETSGSSTGTRASVGKTMILAMFGLCVFLAVD
ncbi:hypothetical protein G7Z17_g9405 [Cylindrodendrum hubeiense]|uniref:Uncharacterized protein n=1 Tax=Cylindrodendrum hubeiense TaxID=595255 RepID=A0A9P5H998_9HYPO|nr:hypothetical protein G7Z17_g9405 [Cylindrodendrum hubeiense]